MAHAYTPGLRVAEHTTVRRERRLPLKGEVLVKEGQAVTAQTIVARTLLPGNVQTVNLANALGVEPGEVQGRLLKPLGSEVEAGEVIAQTKALFGLMKSDAKSPAQGVLESVSAVTGQLILREPPIPVEIDAYLDGTVVEVLPEEGRGHRDAGRVHPGASSASAARRTARSCSRPPAPDDELTADRLNPGMKGKIVVGGAYVNHAVFKEAIRLGVKAVVVGGFDDRDLRELLGYDLGVAITGQESFGATLLLTEGFGRIRMSDRTFTLLKKLRGEKPLFLERPRSAPASCGPRSWCRTRRTAWAKFPRRRSSAWTSARCCAASAATTSARSAASPQLPAPLQELGSESHARVLEAELDGVGRVLLPRANVELIEA
jgi:hypothetical protein